MRATEADEQQLRTLVDDFVVAVERGVPREIAALLCAEEAESLLDHVDDPDEYEPIDVTEAVPATIHGIQVFGDIAVVAVNRITDEVKSLYCRRVDGRWLCCEHAEFDLTAAQLDGAAGDAAERVGALSNVPIGELALAQLCVLVDHGVARRNLLPILFRHLDWGRVREDDPAGYVQAVSTVFAVDPDYWVADSESQLRARLRAEDVLRDATDDADDALARLATEFLAAR